MCYVQRIAQINCVHMMYISSLSHPSPPIDGGDRGMGRSRGSPPSMLLRGLPCFIVCFSNCTIIENFFGCVPLDSPCRDEFLLFSNIFVSSVFEETHPSKARRNEIRVQRMWEGIHVSLVVEGAHPTQTRGVAARVQGMREGVLSSFEFEDTRPKRTRGGQAEVQGMRKGVLSSFEFEAAHSKQTRGS